MVVDLLLTPFVLVAAVLFLLGAICSLGAGCCGVIRLCRYANDRLPESLQGSLIKETISLAAAIKLITAVEKISYVGAVAGWLIFGPQVALFTAYGAVFTIIACTCKAVDGGNGIVDVSNVYEVV